MEIVQSLFETLTKCNLTLATAESCTGGMIGAAITAAPGVSSVFKGGIIAYSNEVKTQLLGVSSEILESFGAVSRETVTAMARGVCDILGSDCAISVSGIAGPEGGTEQKPVGTVWISVHTPDSTDAFHYVFGGDREAVRQAATSESLGLLLRQLQG